MLGTLLDRPVKPGDDSLVVAGGLLAMTKRSFDSNFKQQIHVHILAAGDARGLRFVSLKLEGAAPGRADLPSADLTPTTEASGPHDFTVRFSIVRPARRRPLTETALRTNFTPDTAASTASHPNVR